MAMTMRHAKSQMRHMSLWALSLSALWLLMLLGQAAGYDQTCSALPEWSAGHSSDHSPVLQVHTTGRATGVYTDLRHGAARWQLRIGQFTSTGHGVVVGQFVVTAAHVVYPSQVEIGIPASLAPIVAPIESGVTIGNAGAAEDMPAEMVHINHRFDLAILRPMENDALLPLIYPPAATWWQELPGQMSSLLQAGACVVVLVATRNEQHMLLPQYEAREGKVIAPFAVSDWPLVVADLNSNTVTISPPLLPGDSGSPVLAFIEGTPHLVGIVTATRYPDEPLSYLSRIDPLLPILQALAAPERHSTRLQEK